jgi:hypothetical protein
MHLDYRRRPHLLQTIPASRVPDPAATPHRPRPTISSRAALLARQSAPQRSIHNPRGVCTQASIPVPLLSTTPNPRPAGLNRMCRTFATGT